MCHIHIKHIHYIPILNVQYILFCNEVSNKTCKSSLDFRQEYAVLSSQSNGSPGGNYGSSDRDHSFFSVEEINSCFFYSRKILSGREY